MPSTLTEQLKDEFRRAEKYDGPAPARLSVGAMRASFGMLNSFPWSGDESESDDWVKDVAWAFDRDEFPGLAELFEIDGDTIRWSDDVSRELRDEISEFTKSLVDPIHVYRVPRPRA